MLSLHRRNRSISLTRVVSRSACMSAYGSSLRPSQRRRDNEITTAQMSDCASEKHVGTNRRVKTSNVQKTPTTTVVSASIVQSVSQCAAAAWLALHWPARVSAVRGPWICDVRPRDLTSSSNREATDSDFEYSIRLTSSFVFRKYTSR